MTVISVDTNPDELTLTLVAEFNEPIERIWQLWEDPRQLERWWGPPTWPATFVSHEFNEGGESRYFMAGPDGEKSRGWWKFTSIDAPHTLGFEDGFSGDDGEPSGFLGSSHCVVTLNESDGTTRMQLITRFTDLEQLEAMMKMGMAEGMREAAGQMDAVLAGSMA